MSTRSRRGEAGYSFVELLVTIIIAGIAFAAMVPLFVQAQQTGPKDKYRTTALNIAQDRLERVRQLPFSVVTPERLTDPTLSSQLRWGDVLLDGKTYNVMPYVTDIDATTKTVTITVTWTEPPNSTSREVKLQTKVFRQLPGPQILDVQLNPVPIVSALNGRPYISVVPAGGIEISAIVNPAQASDVGRVKFTIVDMAGTTTPVIQFVSEVDAFTTNRYTYTWSGGATPHDGLYRISVVAYSKDTAAFPAEQGNTRETDLWIETGVPPAVPDVEVYAGKVTPAVVNLLWSWSSDLAADMDHFEVWRRSAAADGTWAIVGDNVRSYGFADTSVTAGAAYLYAVRAVDTFGNALDPATLASYAATPQASGAAAPPARPTNLRLSFAGGTMTVIWQPPTGSIADVVGYHVYRSTVLSPHAGASLVASAKDGGTTYAARDDRLAWGTTYYYTVKSFNADGAESTVAQLAVGQAGDGDGWAQYITPAVPWYQLYIQVKNISSKKSAVVNVIDTSTGEKAAGPITLTAASPATTVDLEFGVYTVTMVSGTTTKATSASLTGDPTKIVYVTFVL